MYFEVNVSKNGVHFFATHERSIRTTDQLEEVLHVLRQNLTKYAGYEITAYVRRVSRLGIDIEAFLADPDDYKLPAPPAEEE